MKQLILASLLSFASLLPAQVTLVNHAAAGYSTGVGTTPVTTAAINTTGANFIGICAAGASSNTTAPTDNCGNSYALLANTQNEDGDVRVTFWYAFAPNTCASHTFTFSGSGPSGAVMAFSGVASGPDQQNKSQGTSPITTGSVSPSNANELVVSCAAGGYANTTYASASPLTLVDSVASGSSGAYNSGAAVASAYQVQTTSTPVNATWVGGMGAVLINTFYSTRSPAPFTIASTALPEGFNAVPYSYQLLASGGIGPYSWTLVSGTLPTGLTMSSTGLISGTPTQTVLNSALTFQVTDSSGHSIGNPVPPVTSSMTMTIAAAPLAFSTTSCPTGTQYQAYAGCSLAASGGTPPYSYSVATSTYAALPEGLTLNPSTGVISGSQIGGQGTYKVQFIVADAEAATVTQVISFGMAGSNGFLASIFPSNSIFHTRIDGLPVDTSPAAPIPGVYQPAYLHVFFGNAPGGNGYTPNGIPVIEVPYNQADVAVATTEYQSYFTSAPIPANAPIEDTANFSNPYNYNGDGHVLVYQQAGGGNPPALYELFVGQLQGNGSWVDVSNALWPDVTTNAFTPQGNGTTDAAGLPVAPLLVNADEVIGTGTPSAPNGTVQHPIRFTLNHMLNYWVWPATSTSGVQICSSSGGTIPIRTLLSQSAPPVSCTQSAPAGEIYRLMASVATPACASTSPQAAIIIRGLRQYGIILADNGISGGLIGTPDTRWNDSDLACLRQLTLANFEPVNVSAIMVGTNSGQALTPSFTLSINDGGAGSGTIGGTNCTTGTYVSGTVYSCTATPAYGSILAGWSDSCGGTIAGSTDSGTVTSGCAITANFIPTPPSTVWQGMNWSGVVAH